MIVYVRLTLYWNTLNLVVCAFAGNQMKRCWIEAEKVRKRPKFLHKLKIRTRDESSGTAIATWLSRSWSISKSNLNNCEVTTTIVGVANMVNIERSQWCGTTPRVEWEFYRVGSQILKWQNLCTIEACFFQFQFWERKTIPIFAK